MNRSDDTLDETLNKAAKKPVRNNQRGGGTFGFQLVVACILIAAAIVLKTAFPTTYEDIRKRYFVLLNEEINFGSVEKYISDLLKVGDDIKTQRSFDASSEITSITPSSIDDEQLLPQSSTESDT